MKTKHLENIPLLFCFHIFVSVYCQPSFLQSLVLAVNIRLLQRHLWIFLIQGRILSKSIDHIIFINQETCRVEWCNKIMLTKRSTLNINETMNELESEVHLMCRLCLPWKVSTKLRQNDYF